ncbi:MAG: DUF4293 domain-containing protein [Bacteroidales bacterium]|jgi:hypothetical protein|nr:DUF4293 domain-containing protein [Bacteroidales bacterium]MDD3161043.1 DUF4293 domain-containing protein [Bacteroidales bacterium]
MIQRIQTVYLFLVICLSVLTAFFPLAEFIGKADKAVYEMTASGVYNLKAEMLMNSAGLLIVLLAVTLLAIAELFLFKKRMLQIRLGIYSMLLLGGFYLISGFLAFLFVDELNADFHLKFAAGIPFVCLILEYLAIRAIGKDEALIRSLNRLR